MRLADKVAIITGAGSEWAAAAEMFAAEEQRSWPPTSTNATPPTPGSPSVGSRWRGGVRPGRCLAGGTDAAAMVAAAMDRYGRIDVLYNNAGIMPEADHSVTDTDVAVGPGHGGHCPGVFLGCKYAIPRMVEQVGSVINISLFVALLGCSVPQDAYTASKGGPVPDPSLAVQFGPHGVRLNAICPGPIETPMLMEWLVKDEEARKLRLARIRRGGSGDPRKS